MATLFFPAVALLRAGTSVLWVQMPRADRGSVRRADWPVLGKASWVGYRQARELK